MILYDGLYEWDGKSTDGKQPICWWPGSYRMRIVDLSSDNPKIIYLKSYAVILKNSGRGTSLKNYIHNFARVVSKKFNIEIEKTLWAEIGHDDTNIDERLMIANIRCMSYVGDKQLLSSVWRAIMPNELKLLAPWIF
ncbi:MAG: hypothetical protein HQK62_03360 [Desulfamplus sp.]|nr:hypothetical protein [Desulfamplus sp.]